MRDRQLEMVARYRLVESQSLRLVAGAGGWFGCVDEKRARTRSIGCRGQVEGQQSILGPGFRDFGEDAFRHGEPAEPVRNRRDGPFHGGFGGVPDLFSRLEPQRVVVAQPGVDLTEVLAP